MRTSIARIADVRDKVAYITSGSSGSDRYYRTRIYVQEVAHRRATRKRTLRGI